MRADRTECVGEAVGIKTVQTCHYRSMFYSLNPWSVTLVSGVGISNTNMADESVEIIVKTQDDGEEDEATSPTACSGASMDDILQVLHLLGKQNNGIENKIQQQVLKIESQVQEIPQRFEELCTRVNTQATQLKSGLKLHEDKLKVKMNALEEEFTQKVNSLDSKQSLF